MIACNSFSWSSSKWRTVCDFKMDHRETYNWQKAARHLWLYWKSDSVRVWWQNSWSQIKLFVVVVNKYHLMYEQQKILLWSKHHQPTGGTWWVKTEWHQIQSETCLSWRSMVKCLPDDELWTCLPTNFVGCFLFRKKNTPIDTSWYYYPVVKAFEALKKNTISSAVLTVDPCIILALKTDDSDCANPCFRKTTWLFCWLLSAAMLYIVKIITSLFP